MTDHPGQGKSRLRSEIATLIVAVAIFVVVIVAGREPYEWYTSIPLDETVAAFNSMANKHPVGKHEPPITEDEIVDAIESQLPNLDASDQIQAIYKRIARTRRLPRGTQLSTVSSFVPSQGENYTVWWVNLVVMTGPQSGYGMRIRETNSPIAAAPSHPLQR